MLRFKHFLIEKLTPEQEQQVSGWERDPKAVSATDHYFGVGNDEKTEELQGHTGDKSEPHKAVERHLGIEIPHEDYKEGLATDKYGRKVRIASLLQKSKAPKNLVNQFSNDSTRQLKRGSGLTVKVTRSPAGVAGQTSRDQSWEQQSCKNFETGSNRHYLKDEVKHGTVVAYLMHPNGTELARATLQPHVDDSDNRVYSVDSHYGIDHAEFKKHVQDLAGRISQTKNDPDELTKYYKHPDVYDDNEIDTILHPNATNRQLNNALLSVDRTVRQAAINHPNATSEHIHRGLIDRSYNVRFAATRHPNATSEHINKALEDEDVFIRSNAANHKNASNENIDKALNDSDPNVRLSVISNPNFSEEHISKALNDDKGLVREFAISHKKTTKEHLDKALEDPDNRVRLAAVRHKNITKDQLKTVLNDLHPDVRNAARDKIFYL